MDRLTIVMMRMMMMMIRRRRMCGLITEIIVKIDNSIVMKRIITVIK